MRMWNVPTNLLCRRHLLGEHLETHLFLGTLKKNKSVKGYLDKGLLEIHNLEKRHEQLKLELVKRGYKHNSPFIMNEKLFINRGLINVEENIKELYRRCSNCRERIKEARIDVFV